MSYQHLEERFRRLGHLYHVAEILHWDEAVIMPAAAGPERAEALGTLHEVLHEWTTDPRLLNWLEEAEAAAKGNLTAAQRANLREMGRIVRRAQALPTDFVSRSTRACMACEQAWREQRARNDWAGFAPLLEEVVHLKQQEAAMVSSALGLSPYDALLEEYDPGARQASIDIVFADLRAFLPSLIERAQEVQSRHDVVVPQGPFPVAAQQELGRRLMAAVAFDMERGRLDVSHHPFCGGNPTDVRITTRYDLDDFSSALMGVLHETGHAKYEQGLPRDWAWQPAGRARGMAMHEGQSLLQEMQICRSRPFVEFAAPTIASTLHEAARKQPEAFTASNLYHWGTRVKPSKIRVDADEVTYPCHILLRYDLEGALIDGSMRVRDIPEAWDAGMRSLLGISTGTDYRDGCMQDSHWPGGAFGYFPMYTLGAMCAAQLFAAAKNSIPQLEEQIRHGHFEAINGFLRTHIWSQGSLLDADEMMQRATGKPLDADAYKAHLWRRYVDESE